MKKLLLEVREEGRTTTVAVDDISAIRRIGDDNRCYIDLKTPLAGSGLNRVVVNRPYDVVMRQIEALEGVCVVNL